MTSAAVGGLEQSEDARDGCPAGAGGGLGVRAGDHRIGARRQDVSEQELQLARLVAAEREAGQVVALDPHVDPAERSAETRAVLERRRQMGEPHPRQGIDPRLQRRAAKCAGAAHGGDRASSRGWCSESLVFCRSLSGLTRVPILEPRFSLP